MNKFHVAITIWRAALFASATNVALNLDFWFAPNWRLVTMKPNDWVRGREECRIDHGEQIMLTTDTFTYEGDDRLDLGSRFRPATKT